MGLSTYHHKRDFKQTKEPRGVTKKGTKDLLFVVQKHNASRLHYDFRLELDGVLLSWAVPKGPSMVASEKHLAVQVEDHPYDYKDFEGVIPEGNYGAGQVIVWDNGTYRWKESDDRESSEAAMRKGIKKGHLEIILAGHKLKGLFHLIRLKNTEWLLFKGDDKFASAKDIQRNEKSVISGKTLTDLGAAKKTSAKKAAVKISSKRTDKVKSAAKKSKSKSAAPSKKKSVKKARIEKRISPMLARLHEQLPPEDDYIYELKYDGFRALASTAGDGKWVDLYSRNLLPLDKKFPVLADELKLIPFAAVLDGEILVEDNKGISKFQLLQQYEKTGIGTLKYYVFDLLFLNGEDVRHLPLTDRKKLLETLMGGFDSGLVELVESKTAVTPSFMQSLRRKGYEGIIAKRADSTYLSDTRSDAWIKVKNLNAQEAVIIGYTAPQGARNHFGSLLLAMKQKDKLKYIGKCGTGFTQSGLKDIFQRMQRLITTKRAVTVPKTEMKDAVWLKPKLICEVRFTEFTDEGIMRHPAFRGLREDKSLADINNEVALPARKKKASSTAAKKTIAKSRSKKSNAVSHVIITNPDKIYWPEMQISKGDLISYYDAVSEYMLPFIMNRLHSLHRFPNGYKGASFYQKNIDVKQLPEGLETVKIKSGDLKDVNYFLCNSKEALLYMVNLGCIEINPWNNIADSYDYPDWLVIDLDPEGISFKEVVRTAVEVRRFMEEYDIASYCKTSGATGLHIYVPMGRKYHYDEVRTFAEVIARHVHARLPGITSIVRAPAKRRKKIYIDYLQNRHGQTLAAPFSVRPTASASVSMPLEWKEVVPSLSPDQFTIKNALKRADKSMETWKKVLGKGIDMHKVLKKILSTEK